MPIDLGAAKTVAVIGAGGKTTLLGLLARMHRRERVLLTTTTHIRPFPDTVCDRLLTPPDADSLTAALSQPGVTCAGVPCAEGKLTALPDDLMALGRTLADRVLYEADGARGLPLKLHRPTEPVLLPDTDLCIVVAGLSALDQPVGETVHCHTLREDWAEAPDHPVDIHDVLFCVRDAMRAAGLDKHQYHVLLNQADTGALHVRAADIQRALQDEGIACTALSLLY